MHIMNPSLNGAYLGSIEGVPICIQRNESNPFQNERLAGVLLQRPHKAPVCPFQVVGNSRSIRKQYSICSETS